MVFFFPLKGKLDFGHLGKHYSSSSSSSPVLAIENNSPKLQSTFIDSAVGAEPGLRDMFILYLS